MSEKEISMRDLTRIIRIVLSAPFVDTDQLKIFKIKKYIISGIIIILLISITIIFLFPSNFEQDEVSSPFFVENGLSYFNGDKILENQGKPCGQCHSIVSMGVVYEYDIAPDLSKSFLEPPNWYRELPDFEGNATKLTNYLRNPSTGTMKLILQDNPLTPVEVDSLVDLLMYASRQG